MDVPDRMEFEELRSHTHYFAKWSAACAAASLFWARWQIDGRQRLHSAESVRELHQDVQQLISGLWGVGTWTGGSATPPPQLTEHHLLSKQAIAFVDVLQNVLAELEQALRLLNNEGAGAEDPSP